MGSHLIISITKHIRCIIIAYTVTVLSRQHNNNGLLFFFSQQFIHMHVTYTVSIFYTKCDISIALISVYCVVLHCVVIFNLFIPITFFNHFCVTACDKSYILISYISICISSLCKHLNIPKNNFNEKKCKNK